MSSQSEPTPAPGGAGYRPGSGETKEALLLVTESNYVPAGVTLRARVDEHLFTATFPADLLPVLERDPLIQAIALAQPLRLAGREERGSGRFRVLRQCLARLADIVARERAALPDEEGRVIAAWLRDQSTEEVARTTRVPLSEVRNVTARFRFRPAVWEATRQVQQVLGEEGVAALVGVVDLHQLEALLLDPQEVG